MRSLAFSAAVFFIAATVTGQEKPADIINAMKDKAVVLELTARVVERDVTESWNSETSKVTIPGRPVTLRLVGANVVVAVQFTPYKKEDGKNILVAQGQVWVTTKDEGILYYTSMQTIPIEYGERVYFFPLGQRKDDQRARIEVQLVLSPYAEAEQAKKAPAAVPAAAPAVAPVPAPKAEQPKAEPSKQEKPTSTLKTEPTKNEAPRQDKTAATVKAEPAKHEKPSTPLDQGKQEPASPSQAATAETQANE
jgi:nuclear transport factor 2 (NTF2) superfamily protein